VTPREDRRDRATGELGLLGDLAEQVVLHLRAGAHGLGVRLVVCTAKPEPLVRSSASNLDLLPACTTYCMRGDVEVLVEVLDALS
jgi:phosphoglycolate phosphatase-like HAD superfamily hydrolase